MKTIIIRKEDKQYGLDLWVNDRFVGWAYGRDVVLWLYKELRNETNQDLQIPAPIHHSERIQNVG